MTTADILRGLAATPEGAAALHEAGWFRAVPGEARVPLGDGREATLHEMNGADLLTWQRLQLAAARRIRGLDRTDEAGALLALAEANVALVALALGVSEDEAVRLAPSVRREVVAAQDRLNATALYAAALTGGA